MGSSREGRASSPRIAVPGPSEGWVVCAQPDSWRQTEWSQARHAERLSWLERFGGVGAEAERAAFSRPHDWDDIRERLIPSSSPVGKSLGGDSLRSQPGLRTTCT
jgi:hypothetical protein